jgi:hypothetical protein
MNNEINNDTFYIHRVIHVPEFYSQDAFLCDSLNNKNEFDTVFVNMDSGTIFSTLKLKFQEVELTVLYFTPPLRAEGHTILETDCIPGPNYTKRAISVSII